MQDQEILGAGIFGEKEGMVLKDCCHLSSA
jgi:hypothetical protein